MKKLFLVFILFLSLLQPLTAVEGMWIPKLLAQLNEQEMKEMGMRISAEDIYSINQSSLKDAIVLFGRGCTGSIVSDQGLLLTNHHCGFGVIRNHSSMENDYLANGFWAMNPEEELVTPGLTVTMLMKMEDVTDQVLQGVDASMTERERKQRINENGKSLKTRAEESSGFDARVRAFYQGNQYYMLYTQTFRDVRLAGAPPSNIGKFGGDTDNWMWPRHTGDFAVFRIYADTNNKPAEYSPSNIPYTPAKHIPVSLDGVDENDFTFIFGYPARTNSYLPSRAVQMIAENLNPHKVRLRETRLEVFKKYMENNPKVRLQYATKDARVANGWKKMIGESRGVSRLNAVAEKQEIERLFNAWALDGDDVRKATFGELLPVFNHAFEEIEPINMAADYIFEAAMAIELFGFASRFRPLAEMSREENPDQEKLNEMIANLKGQTSRFFDDYHLPIDREIAARLLQLYDENQPDAMKPAFLDDIHKHFNGDAQAYVDELFNKSIFSDEERLMRFLENFKTRHLKRLERDMAFSAVEQLQGLFESKVREDRNRLNTNIDSLQRIYMAGLMEMLPEKRFHPDANFTLRVSYGLVQGYSPADAVYYDYYTTMEGIMEKENPDIYDYVVEPQLKQLFDNRDFGDFADTDGRMRVGFIASNHTTGGNSGSPILNADGEMVGINFDRCWEATMSDLRYDPVMGRNISVDIRYVLFIIDKFAGAGHLLEEMTIHSKDKVPAAL